MESDYLLGLKRFSTIVLGFELGFLIVTIVRFSLPEMSNQHFGLIAGISAGLAFFLGVLSLWTKSLQSYYVGLLVFALLGASAAFIVLKRESMTHDVVMYLMIGAATSLIISLCISLYFINKAMPDEAKRLAYKMSKLEPTLIDQFEKAQSIDELNQLVSSAVDKHIVNLEPHIVDWFLERSGNPSPYLLHVLFKGEPARNVQNSGKVIEMIQVLSKHNVPINYFDTNYMTPLGYAMQFTNSPEVIQAMLDHGAKMLEGHDSIHYMAPLHYFFERSERSERSPLGEWLFNKYFTEANIGDTIDQLGNKAEDFSYIVFLTRYGSPPDYIVKLVEPKLGRMSQKNLITLLLKMVQELDNANAQKMLETIVNPHLKGLFDETTVPDISSSIKLEDLMRSVDKVSRLQNAGLSENLKFLLLKFLYTVLARDEVYVDHTILQSIDKLYSPEHQRPKRDEILKILETLKR